MIKIMLADDQALIRQSIHIVINSLRDFKVVGVAKDGEEVLELLEKERADIILMDVRMPVMDGVTCTKLVKNKYPNTKVIMLTTFNDDEYVFSALKYGASGYLLKGVSVEELENAIRVVYDGGAMLNPDVASKVVSQFQDMVEKNYDVVIEVKGISEITDAEWEIIRLVGHGKSNKEIAAEIAFTEGTIRNYISSILSKLGLRDRTQLAIWEIQSGTRKYKKSIYGKKDEK